MSPLITYSFSDKLWKSAENGGWYFVSLPRNMSAEIREHLGDFEEGWGRLKTTAVIYGLEWQTAIWFDTKSKTYLLPIKSALRNKFKLQVDQNIEVILKV